MRRADHEREVEQYRQIITDIWWMARRYADGRATYSTCMMNEATRRCLQLGILIKPDAICNSIWAKDQHGRGCDGLSEKEAVDGSPEALGIHLGNNHPQAVSFRKHGRENGD